ncbi:RNA-directed DNA polymerase, eukaryota [Tanacetum coccineum]
MLPLNSTWNACKQYGYVVDAFIPNRRSKAGKRFGFVHFIKVFDVERLLVNYARCGLVDIEFTLMLLDSRDQRCTTVVKDFGSLSNLKVVLGNEGFDNIELRYLGGLWVMIEFKSVEVKEKFQSNAGTGSWFSQLFQASNDFIIDGRVTWVDIEGIPLKVWTENTFNRIASKWGTLLNADNSKEGCFHSKRLCIYMTGMFNIFESFKLIYQGKAYWVRAKEVLGWILDFVEQNDEDSESDDEQFEGDFKEDIGRSDEELDGENDVNVVPDTVFEEETHKSNDEEDSIGQNEKQSEDPFNIYSLLNKKKGENNKDSSTKDSLKYPPGFTPRKDVEADFQMSNKGNSFVRENGDKRKVSDDLNSGSKNNWSKKDGTESVVSGHFKKAESPHTGGSLLILMDELIKVGQTMGYNMAGDSVGNSGGILCVWDSNSFMKVNATVSDYFVMIRGNWVTNGKLLLIILVYASQELTEKKLLWDYLGHVIANWKDEVIIMGDFNEVRNKNERFGSIYNVQGATAFNLFISNAGLEEVPLGGCSFTWCHRSASKMSKLDRFLMSESLLGACPNFSTITLDRYLSDHRLILLRESTHDYGPILFRFFHYWFEVDGFEKLVNEAWYETQVDASNAMLNLMNKLKYLKKKIRAWNDVSDDIINKRTEVVKSIQELDELQSMEAAQKAKIKWAIEGDENSKYYHGVLNKKRNQLSIRGVLAAGNWIENPALVKNKFLTHFKNQFERPNTMRPILNMDFPRQLTSIQQLDMEAEVSNDEIKRAVWDCGIDKSPGPDGFTFGFYRRFWKLIEKDVVAAVKLFFQSGYIPKGCNSSFIALIPKILDAKMVKDFRPISLIGSLYKIIAKILANHLVMVLGDIINEVQSAFVADRQILDGLFILNELFQWCKSKKKQSFIFKVDFEKAYDSVRWDYLDDVLRKFGFGERWCGWIQECLRSSWGSVIVNGSPMEEFQFFKGLKQGNPLSLFIFILIMESLHISFQRAVNAGMFKGIVLDSSMQLSHIFYADDAVFVGQWSNSNIDTIVHVLKCFHYASGLSINMSKSKIMGIAVTEERVEQVASRIRCDILKVPMKVLQRMESIRCHFFNGVDLDSKKSIWAKWNNVLTSKEKGGLGVVIKAIHGEDGKIGKCSKSGHKSIWQDIVQEMDAFKKQGNMALKHRYPRLYALELNKKIDVAAKLAQASLVCSFRRDPRSGVEHSQLVDLVDKIEGVSLVAMNDRWTWALEGSGDFSVASVRKLLDDKRLPDVSSQTCWIKAVPIKVNIHAWKVRLDCLPTRLNISRRGMDIASILCPICGSAVELSSHLFFDCHVAKDNFRKICRLYWKGDAAFKTVFPRIYALELFKDISVAEKMAHPSISFSFRRDPRLGSELVQMASLQSHLEGIVLSNMLDRWIWSLSGDGEFSVSSVRNSH